MGEQQCKSSGTEKRMNFSKSFFPLALAAIYSPLLAESSRLRQLSRLLAGRVTGRLYR
jgi:hypothetical protein